MSDELGGGSLFSQHLFSTDLFGGNPMKRLGDSAVLYKLSRTGTPSYVEELTHKLTSTDSWVAGDVPVPESEVTRIRYMFGPGEYEIVCTDLHGGQRRTRFFVSKESSLQDLMKDLAQRPHASVRTTMPALSAAFVHLLPLHSLSSMLLSAGLGDSPAVARAVVDGWVSERSLASTELAALDETLRPTHPWLTLLPVFYDRSDTDIYRAYVDAKLIVDRDDIREHILDGISRVRVLCEKLSTKNAAEVSQQRGTWYLWLDDERNPKTVLAADNGEACLGERYRQYVNDGLTEVPWRWARSVEQAIWMYEAYGHPLVMALDHDLGGNSTAIDFLRWVSDSGLYMSKWYVHSANPVGRANIQSFLRSWERAHAPSPSIDDAITNDSATLENMRKLQDMVAARLDAAADAADAAESLDREAEDEAAKELEEEVDERMRGTA